MSVAHKRMLYVGGLDDAVTEELVRAAFIPFGEILSINLPADTVSRKHRGFGFVEFETIEDASAAVDNMHNSELMGKVITCVTASPAVLGNKGKPVWADDNNTGLEDGQEGQTTEQNDEDSRIKTSEVLVNAPKRLKTSEINAQPIPQGFKRCKRCGGWGKDLVKEDGYCNHCRSIEQK